MAVLSGCDQKPKNPVAEYGDTMIDAYQRGKQAGVDGNLYAIRQAVKAYHAANDKYPQNLNEIEPLLGGKEVDLSRYDYDPQTGHVNLKNGAP
ncbi:MAG: hypothetical protein A2X59_02005 [Nitrospirae bacterium GWC2_42_7]|nr:MAG: hypothetical protein A2X59_02005 [Nitrospirae bacterium GWC2_42_7]